jgi:hypothetical protein
MEIGPTANEDELPDYVDPTLSFEMDGYPGRNFLIGNPHTFPGRMEAYSEAERRAFAVSLNEMTNVSPAARAWISGFLSGSEPAPPYFAGDERAKAVEDDWRAAALQFGTNGQLPTIGDERVVAARGRIQVAAEAVVSQADFAGFLRVLDADLRESSGKWTSVAGELFFDVWAAALDSANDPSNYGLGESIVIEAEWPLLARSIVSAVFTD